MTSPLTLAARLQLESQQWDRNLAKSRTATRGFVAGVKREFSDLRSFMQSTTGRLATLGAGFSFANELRRSAGMDKSLTQLGQTAGATQQQVRGLRGELFGMAADTGRNVADIQEGFNVLVQSGLNWKESRATIADINKTMAVTGAQAQTLAGSLGVASTAFDFDLSKPKEALGILDRMTVAGRQGNAELENLGSIFSRVGQNAKGAGFDFDQTLAFIEGLSMIERQPERLATLADSTLRLFTNAKYLKDAQKATGVQFFDKSGARRDPLVVLAEMKKLMDGMKTDAQREGFLTKAFGQADLDTIKGMRTLLSGSSLSRINDFTRNIRGATGTIERDLPNAINNAVDQSGRLKARLIEAADGFAKPINNAFSRLTNWALNSKEQGGAGLSGNQLAVGGAVTLAALYAGGKGLKGVLGRLSGGAASLGTGVAMGQALDKVGAATPVFIVGAAPGVFAGAGAAGGLLDAAAGGGKAGKAGRWGRLMAGLGAWGTRAGVVSAAAFPVVAGMEFNDYPQTLAKADAERVAAGRKMPYERALDWFKGLPGSDVKGLPGKLDIAVVVKDDRVTATVQPRADFSNVSATVTTTTRGQPARGRMMAGDR